MKYLFIWSTYRWKDNENNSIFPCTNNLPVEFVRPKTQKKHRNQYLFEEGNCIEIKLFLTTVKLCDPFSSKLFTPREKSVKVFFALVQNCNLFSDILWSFDNFCHSLPSEKRQKREKLFFRVLLLNLFHSYFQSKEKQGRKKLFLDFSLISAGRKEWK